MVKTRTFVLTKNKYTKEEVQNILSEVIEEAKQKGFKQYDEIRVDEEDFGFDDNGAEVEYDESTPNTVIKRRERVEICPGLYFNREY